MKECFILAQDKRKQCELACQIGNDSSTCKGTSELIYSITNLSMAILHPPWVSHLLVLPWMLLGIAMATITIRLLLILTVLLGHFLMVG